MYIIAERTSCGASVDKGTRAVGVPRERYCYDENKKKKKNGEFKNEKKKDKLKDGQTLSRRR